MKSLDKLEINSNLWTSVNFIQQQLAHNDEQMSSIVEINWQKFQFCKQNTLALPYYNIEKMAQKLNISIDHILRGDVSQDLSPQQIREELLNSLDSKYKFGIGSKSFTLRHIIKLADKKNIKESVLKEFNIPPHLILAKVDFEIPVQLVADIIDFMATQANLNDEDFNYLADLNAFYFKDSGFGKMMRAARTPYELYENLIFVTKYLEENWSYEISSIKNDKVILTSHPTEKLIDLYQKKNYASINFTRFRIAVAARLLKYIGVQEAEAKIIRSIHQNDHCDQFSLDLRASKPQSSLESNQLLQ